MMKSIVVTTCLTMCAVAFGQGKEDFMRQQAFAEMQRVSGQIDVLQSNFNELQGRVNRLEGGSGESTGIRQELESLKMAVAELRRTMQNQREEIVKDLSGRLSKLQQSVATPKPQPKQVVVGPHVEYVVQSGDTLSLIASAFNTTVGKIREMNNMKGDMLRVGQKLMLPKQ